MGCDYYTLKKMAEEGSRIGKWNGKAVFATSAAQLQNLGSGAFFVLYDYDNKIVARDGEYFYSYGTVSKNGTINEYDGRRKYSAVVAREEHHHNTAMQNKLAPVATPGYNTEIDVEKVLKSAREMSVGSLLDGFLERIDFSVAKG